MKTLITILFLIISLNCSSQKLGVTKTIGRTGCGWTVELLRCYMGFESGWDEVNEGRIKVNKITFHYDMEIVERDMFRLGFLIGGNVGAIDYCRLNDSHKHLKSKSEINYPLKNWELGFSLECLNNKTFICNYDLDLKEYKLGILFNLN